MRKKTNKSQVLQDMNELEFLAWLTPMIEKLKKSEAKLKLENKMLKKQNIVLRSRIFNLACSNNNE